MIQAKTKEQIGRKLARLRHKGLVRLTRPEQIMKSIPPEVQQLIRAEIAKQLVESGAFVAWADRADDTGKRGEAVLLPSKPLPFYETATPEEWITAFNEWAESHRDLPPVPVSAFSREADYEDRD